jgi:hypothetical protein
MAGRPKGRAPNKAKRVKAKRVNVRQGSVIVVSGRAVVIFNARRYGTAGLLKYYYRVTKSSIERLGRLCKGAQDTTLRWETWCNKKGPRVDFLF